MRKTKAKAVQHQNEIRDLLRVILCPPFDKADIESRPMGNSGSDIILSPKAKEVIDFEIECKRHEDSTWKNSFKKSFEQTFKYENGILIRRKNRQKNHFYCKLNHIKKIDSFFFKNEENIKIYPSLKLFATNNDYCLSIFEDYVHFNDKKFIGLLKCLTSSYFR